MEKGAGTHPKIGGADISGGKAKVPISWCNEVDGTQLPEFRYESTPTFAGNLPIRTFCACTDGCSAQKGCVCYEMSTVKLEKPGRVSDAHLLSENSFDSVLFECTADCACAGTCANRLSPLDGRQKQSLQIFKVPKVGFACRTLKPIRKGNFVSLLAGEIVSINFLTEIGENPQMAELTKNCLTFQDEERQLGFVVRMDRQCNESRFFTNACCPNLRPIHLFREWLTSDRPIVAFVAIREISAGEELNYFRGNHWLLARLLTRPKYSCRCPSPFCIWPSNSAKKEEGLGTERERREKAKLIRNELARREQQRNRERHMEKKRRKNPAEEEGNERERKRGGEGAEGADRK